MSIKSIFVLFITLASVIYITSNPVHNSYSDKLLMSANIDFDSDKSVIIDLVYETDKSNYVGFTFNPNGPNQLMGLDRMYYTESKTPFTKSGNSSAIEVFKSCTDWIGPVMVKDNTLFNEYKSNFTGGWHTINQNNTENQTARTRSIKVMVDSIEVDKDYNGRVKLLEIWVVNEIIGYNNDFSKPWSPLLLETVKYSITKRNISVDVEITALKNATIERYYGLQTQNSPWADTLSYESHSDNDNEIFKALSDNQSTTKSDGNIIENIRLENDLFAMVVHLDTKYGVGNYKYVDDTKPYAFTKQYGKSYFNLINGRSLNLKSGESFFWRGQYMFTYK